MSHLLHSSDFFEYYCWQNYTTVSKTDLYVSYFDLSYILLGHNDCVERGLTVLVLPMKVWKKNTSKLQDICRHYGPIGPNTRFIWFFIVLGIYNFGQSKSWSLGQEKVDARFHTLTFLLKFVLICLVTMQLKMPSVLALMKIFPTIVWNLNIIVHTHAIIIRSWILNNFNS